MGSDIDRVKRALVGREVELVTYILGQEPNKRRSSATDVRWGSNGSFSLCLVGHKRGCWFDFEGVEGGDLISLVQHRLTSGNFGEAIRCLIEWLGLPPDQDSRSKVKKSRLPPAEKPLDVRTEADTKIAKARKLWALSHPIAPGSAADRYLRETRAIPLQQPYPACVRCDPFFSPEVVFAATNDAGEVCAVQRVLLTEDGRKRPISAPKQTYGSLDGAVVRLPGPADGPLCIAEGPETAMSIWGSTGNETWVTLGSLSRVSPPKCRRILFCVDDDPRKSNARVAVKKTIRRLRRNGYDVVEVSPWAVRRGDGTDFNDLLQTEGPAAVRKRINAFTHEPRIAREALPLVDGRAILTKKTAQFFNGIDGLIQRIEAISVPVGVGKTRFALEHAARTLARMRRDGDRRTIVIAVPEHRLGAQVLERATEPLAHHGLRTAAWRGRGAKRPDDSAGTMCGDLDRVKLAESVLAAVRKEVCPTCHLRNDCRYLQQNEVDADLWIIPHALLFQKPPLPIASLGIAAVVVDESPWQAGLVGLEPNSVIALDMLDFGQMPLPEKGGERLADIRARAKIALTGLDDGPVTRSAFEQVAFDADTGAYAVQAEWARKITCGTFRGRAANQTIRTMVRFWREVGRLMQAGPNAVSGRIWLERGPNGERLLRVTGRREIHSGWTAPTLLIDASFDTDLVRPYWPSVQQVADLKVDAPHQTVVHVIGRSFAKSMLIPEKGGNPKTLKKVRAALLGLERNRPGGFLVISNKEIIEALDLPPRIERAWFNALVGRDDWKHVSTIVVLGRTVPRPLDAEMIAGALTGDAPKRVGDWYAEEDALLRIRDGDDDRLQSATAISHPDPIVTRILHRICAAEIEQAVGRGRGVSRTADNPLTVIVCNDVPLPIAIDRTAEPWKITDPSTMDLMFAAGGVAFANAEHASRAYPDLWPSAVAAKQARHRRKSVTGSYDRTLLRNCYGKPRLATVKVRPQGLRERAALAFVHLDDSPSPCAAIEALLGPLDLCQILAGPISLKSTDEQAEIRRALAFMERVGEMFFEFEPDDPRHAASAVFMRRHLSDAVAWRWNPEEVKDALSIRPQCAGLSLMA